MSFKCTRINEHTVIYSTVEAVKLSSPPTYTYIDVKRG